MYTMWHIIGVNKVKVSMRRWAISSIGIPLPVNRIARFIRRITLGLILVAFSADAGDYPILKLSSGREIGIIGKGVLQFSEGNPAWWLRYETHVKIEKVEELRAEALEVWEAYRSEADRSGLTNAALSANEPRSGTLVTTEGGYNFIFQKQADGTWKMP